LETKHPIEATCPDCRGPLSETVHGELCEYSCLVGHAYSARNLLQAHSETQEKALWAAVVALEESVNLVDVTASQFSSEVAQSLKDQALAKSREALEIRKVLERLEPFRTG